jgi:hypothetical protein
MIQGFSGGLLNRELIYNLDLPSFQRDFASLKTLDHGTGPNIDFERLSGATYFDADGVLQTAANDVPRFDHDPATGASSLGLLIEEARTNSIRNSQGGGSTNGVIGSGGVLPTNWQAFVASGISHEVVASGTSNGLAYVDLKLSGTSTASGFIQIYPESLTQVVASSGQSWTASMYLAVVAGSTGNITDPRISVVGRDSGATLLENTNLSVTLTGTLARHGVSRALTNASTVRVSMQFLGTVADGATIDITLRIAAPQLELGAFPTSYIPTTSAAATRSADSAVVTPISSFYNQSEGTLFAEASSNDSTASRFSTPVGVGTSNNERIFLHRNANSSQGRIGIITGGISQAAADIGAWTLGAVAKIAIAFKTDDVAATINGASATTDTSVVVPTADKFSIGNAVVASSSFPLNGHIRKIAYWPKRLTNRSLSNSRHDRLPLQIPQ